MTKFFRRAAGPCLGALAIAVLSQSAAAQPTSAQQSAIRSNCRSDFMSNCSGVQPGGKDALMCLQKNVAKLSSGCQTAVRATLPAEQPAKTAEPAAAPPPPAAAAASPASISSAPPPPAQTAKKPVKKPATASVAPSAAPARAPASAPPVQPEPSGRPSGLAPAAAVVAKACARYIFMHCRDVPPGGGREVACLTNYVNSGHFVGPRCRGALQVSGLLR